MAGCLRLELNCGLGIGLQIVANKLQNIESDLEVRSRATISLDFPQKKKKKNPYFLPYN